MIFRTVLSEFSWKRWQNTGLLVAGLAIGRPHNVGLIPQTKGSMSRRFVESVEELFPKPVLLRSRFGFLGGVGVGADGSVLLRNRFGFLGGGGDGSSVR